MVAGGLTARVHPLGHGELFLIRGDASSVVLCCGGTVDRRCLPGPPSEAVLPLGLGRLERSMQQQAVHFCQHGSGGEVPTRDGCEVRRALMAHGGGDEDDASTVPLCQGAAIFMGELHGDERVHGDELSLVEERVSDERARGEDAGGSPGDQRVWPLLRLQIPHVFSSVCGAGRRLTTTTTAVVTRPGRTTASTSTASVGRRCS